jgi:dolichol-phosphate mannosyltransferase
MGIGSAYLDGFKEALSSLQPDILVEMDADLQHPPSVIPKLVSAIAEGGADVAVASRYVKGGRSRGWGLSRRLVSKGANWLARTLLGLQVRDCTSGMRAYRKSSAQRLVAAKLPASGFEFQVAALYTLKDKAKVVEVPFVFQVRKAGVSKLKFKDVVRFFLYLIWVTLG